MIKNNNEIQDSVIQRIKRLRIEKNISQLALSKILGISNGQIGNIESPRYKHKYTLRQVYTFCKYIDYPFELIFLTECENLLSNRSDLLIKKIIEYDE